MDKPAPEDPGAQAIQVRGLWKSYGRQAVLRGLDLDVRWGEFLVIFGPNGAGKTTLIKLLATLAKPTQGSLFIAGMDAGRRGAAVRRLLGVVMHQTLLYDDLTAYENLRFYCRMYGVPQAQERIQALVQVVGLEPQLHRRVRTLSNGMQKRLSLARALLHDPPILLLDEPETGLDQEAQQGLAALLGGEMARRRTVVVTTHNLEQGLALGDRVAILAGGRITYQEDRAALDAASFRGAYERFTGAKP